MGWFLTGIQSISRLDGFGIAILRQSKHTSLWVAVAVLATSTLIRLMDITKSITLVTVFHYGFIVRRLIPFAITNLTFYIIRQTTPSVRGPSEHP